MTLLQPSQNSVTVPSSATICFVSPVCFYANPCKQSAAGTVASSNQKLEFIFSHVEHRLNSCTIVLLLNERPLARSRKSVTGRKKKRTPADLKKRHNGKINCRPDSTNGVSPLQHLGVIVGNSSIDRALKTAEVVRGSSRRGKRCCLIGRCMP